MSEFDKIIGYESEKEELARLCDTLKNRAKYAKLSMNMPQTLLLYGPPGVGKTLMAKAFIAESKRKVFYCKKDKSDGEFIAAIKDTFAEAKKKAPSIIFFDDMDKFAEDNLNQNCNKEEFVAIQSGLEDIRGANVFVIATANDICNLPNSLLRAGRFGRQIHVEVPDYDNSVKIIEHYLTGKNVAEDVHAELLARTLQGKSCAVLEEIMNEAAMYAGFDEEAEKICLEHVEKAIPRVLFKTIPEREKNGRARELAAYHEAGHALVAFRKKQNVCYVSIYNDGVHGGVCFSEKSDRAHDFEEEYNEILISLAGKAAVELQFGEPAAGTDSDMEQAWNTLRDHVEKIAVYGFEYCNHTLRFEYNCSFALLDKSYDRINRLMEACYNECRALLLQNKAALDRLAQALMAKDILFYNDIAHLLLIRD